MLTQEIKDIHTNFSFSEQLYKRSFKDYYSPLCQFAFNILSDQDEAEEIVQNVFYKWWEKRESLEITQSIKSYLYKSVHNASLNRLKHENIKDNYKQYNATQIDNNPMYATENLHLKEMEMELYKAIESLPEQCRRVFKLSRFEELKYAEIANQLEISIKRVENPQIAGSVNVAYGKTSGLQIASLVNINANEISGAQISGLVNIANKVNKGFQLGLVNYADSSNSIPIGLFSFVRKGGYRRLEIGINEQAFINASLKTGVRRFYTIFQSGIWSQQTSKPIWSYGLGIGKSVFFKNNWNFDFQGTHAFVNNGNSLNTDNQLIKIHFIVEKKLSKSTSLAVGPVVNGFFEKKFQNNGKLISDFVPYDLKTYDLINNTVKTWIGFTASIRFFDVNGFGK